MNKKYFKISIMLFIVLGILLAPISPILPTGGGSAFGGKNENGNLAAGIRVNKI